MLDEDIKVTLKVVAVTIIIVISIQQLLGSIAVLLM